MNYFLKRIVKEMDSSVADNTSLFTIIASRLINCNYWRVRIIKETILHECLLHAKKFLSCDFKTIFV